MQSKLWTLSALSVELQRDRRSLARQLETLKPDEQEKAAGRTKRTWRLRRVIDHLFGSGEALDGAKERARKDKELADKYALENAVRRGELMEVDRAEQEYGTLVMAARARLLQLPGKCAQMAPANTQIEVERIVRTEVYAALTELSRMAQDENESMDERP